MSKAGRSHGVAKICVAMELYCRDTRGKAKAKLGDVKHGNGNADRRVAPQGHGKGYA